MEATVTAPAKRKSTRTSDANNGQGMNWLSQHKRLAIYIRDGLGCAYCGCGVEEGAKLTLDHLQPRSKSGSISDQTNLVTCCHTCNSKRGNRPVEEFAAGVAAYTGRELDCIMKHIGECVARPIDPKAAKAIIDLRGSCLKAVRALKK
jgi:hypothetical protein